MVSSIASTGYTTSGCLTGRVGLSPRPPRSTRNALTPCAAQRRAILNQDEPAQSVGGVQRSQKGPRLAWERVILRLGNDPEEVLGADSHSPLDDDVAGNGPSEIAVGDHSG